MSEAIRRLIDRACYEVDQMLHMILTGEPWKGTFEDWKRLPR